MDKNKRLNRKNERGAITLFVLIACLFFVLILTGVYVYNLNKMQTQEQQIRQIQENYARDIDNIDEIYEELSGAIKVTLSQDPENGTWTKEVTLIGNAEVKEEDSVTIKEFAFSKDSTDTGSLEWQTADNEEKITETIKVTEGGTYYFWVKDSEGEIHQSNPIEVTNIDKTEPTVGSIIAKEESENGNEYDLEKSPWTDKSVYVEKVDGTDGESGHAETTYTVKKDGITIYENIKEPVILEESGIYEIVVTTKDNAGNEATSEPYEIKIDKVVPILALKHNDANGQDYDGTWTKDDLYGEINIDTSSTGKSVEKYQYSYNGVVWNDISSEIIPTSIDYTTTFPMSGDKPEWINGPVNNGTYYFETQEDGTIKPSNSGINSVTANSYFEIDLTDYPEAELQITINATISSERNYDFGYATITTSETAPEYSSTDGRFIYVSGSTNTADYTTTLTGGQKYYLHIGYRKDSSGSSNQDTFIINNINFKSEKLTNNINFYEYIEEGNKVTFKLQEDVEKEMYVRAVYTDGTTSKYGDKTTIKIDKTAPIIESSNIEIISRTEAKVDIKVKEEASGMKGYYISTDNTEPTESSEWIEQSLKEFTIEGLNTDTTYYLWIIDNVGNISEKQEIVIGKTNYQIDTDKYRETLEEAISVASDGSTIELLNDYTDTSTATFDKNVAFDVKGYTLTRDKTITINNGKQVEITGTGKITSGTNSVRTITNSGTLTISNSITIENMSTSSSYAPIYTNNYYSITNINDNVQIIGYYRGIYNSSGTVNINGGKIEATYENNNAIGTYNTSKLYVNGGEIKGYNGIYNGSTLEMTGGKVIGTNAYGINAYGTTNNIYGGRIEGKTYGVYSSRTDKVIIGREEDELSITNPAIYGGNYGIYMNNETYSFNFYNGVIISNTRDTAYRGVLNPRIGHMPYTYIDYEVEQKYCTILTPTVGNIEMKAEPTEYTNQNVTVTITYPYIQGITREYSEDGTEWKQAEEYIQEVIVEENKTIYARTINESGVITEEKQLEVTNIDKEKPTVEIVPTQTKYTVIETDGTVDLNITIKAQDTGVSGLEQVQYAWIEEGETPDYTDFTNEVTINKTKLNIGTYHLYINVTDKAGNKADIEQIRYIVEYQEPVAQIGDTKYLTIQEAIEACSKTAGETQTTIEILKNTDEEFSTYEGQNIIIDLKGYTIGSSNPNTPICTNNGTLQIIDTSTEKTGKLESLNGTAIENKGTLIIGDNSTEIEMEVPTIYGKQIGIKNEGTFNFYDGKIQGIVPIQGSVTNTPDQYGPVSTGYENGITTIQLGIVSGYEARIEWVYYTTVQGAVNAARTDANAENIETVTIIKDIQLKEILEINISKNMILDLNGYTLTITEQDRVINNDGNLEVTDSSIEHTGKISIFLDKAGTSSNRIYTAGIYNNGNQRLKVSGGTIEVSSTGSYNYPTGIYNVNNGIIEVTGGTVSSSNNSSYSYGIYNENSGTIEVIGGTVSSSGSYSNGIYNYSSGNIEVIGGTVSSSGSYSNGIYNYSSGNIEVIGGTVNSSKYGIYNENNGIVEISGGIVNSNNINIHDDDTYGIYNENGGTIRVTDGTVNSTYDSSSIDSSIGIYNESDGIIEILGGTIKSNSTNLSSGIVNGHTIVNKGTGGILNITGGLIQSEGSGASRGIWNFGTTIIENGNISSICNEYTMAYGIDNHSDGTLIIGNREEEISQDNLIIKGENTYNQSFYKTCGVFNNNGEVEFNNGLIQGKRAVIGPITKVRDGYQIENTTIENFDSIYLTEKANEEYVAQIDGNQYISLQEAINSIEKDEEKTIKIIKDFEINEPITFDKNVKLDLNGHIITNNYYQIENKEKLVITDETGNNQGKIQVSTLIGITNSEDGIITIEAGIISNNINERELMNYTIFNRDNAMLEIKGGLISSSNESNRGDSGVIYNIDNASIQMTGGTVKVEDGTDSYGILNDSSGIIEITEGTISSTGGYSYGISSSKGNVKMSGGTISCNASSAYDGCGIYSLSRRIYRNDSRNDKC